MTVRRTESFLYLVIQHSTFFHVWEFMLLALRTSLLMFFFKFFGTRTFSSKIMGFFSKIRVMHGYSDFFSSVRSLGLVNYTRGSTSFTGFVGSWRFTPFISWSVLIWYIRLITRIGNILLRHILTF